MAAVGEIMLHREVSLVFANAGEVLIEATLELGEREDVVGARGDRARGLQRALARLVVAIAAGEGDRVLLLGSLRDHVHHTTGRRAAVDAGVRALDNFETVDVRLTVAAETVETVTQLRR